MIEAGLDLCSGQVHDVATQKQPYDRGGTPVRLISFRSPHRSRRLAGDGAALVAAEEQGEVSDLLGADRPTERCHVRHLLPGDETDAEDLLEHRGLHHAGQMQLAARPCGRTRSQRCE